MLLTELIPMLTRLGFDTTELPPSRGAISLSEIQYDQVDDFWHFVLRWRDIQIDAPASEIPDHIWQAISFYASAGRSNVMVFAYSNPISCRSNTPATLVERLILQEMFTLGRLMRDIEKQLAAWKEQKHDKV